MFKYFKLLFIGTFAVASMMVGVVQSELMNKFNEKSVDKTKLLFDFEITPIIITASLTFFVGIFQVI